MPAEEPDHTSSAADPQTGPHGAQASDARLRIGPLAGVLAGLAGGMLTWAILETCFPVFTITVPDEVRFAKAPPPPELLTKLARAQAEADFYNVILALEVFAAVVGTSLALGEGAARRSLKTALPGVALGSLLAALFGLLAGWLGNVVFEMCRAVADLGPLAKTMATQGVMLGTLGAGVGLGLGAVSRRRRIAAKCMIAGLLAGVLAALVYPFLVARLLPAAKTEVIVPLQSNLRLLWIGLTAGSLGLVVPAVGRDPGPRTRRGTSAG